MRVLHEAHNTIEQDFTANIKQVKPIIKRENAILFDKSPTSKLDKNQVAEVQRVGQILDRLIPAVVLMAVRNCIQLDRIVKFNLDEDQVFGPVLTRINKAIIDEV